MKFAAPSMARGQAICYQPPASAIRPALFSSANIEGFITRRIDVMFFDAVDAGE